MRQCAGRGKLAPIVPAEMNRQIRVETQGRGRGLGLRDEIGA